MQERRKKRKFYVNDFFLYLNVIFLYDIFSYILFYFTNLYISLIFESRAMIEGFDSNIVADCFTKSQKSRFWNLFVYELQYKFFLTFLKITDLFRKEYTEKLWIRILKLFLVLFIKRKTSRYQPWESSLFPFRVETETCFKYNW